MNKIVTFFRESSLARFLIPVGIIFIVFGIIVFNINISNKDYIETEAIVSNVILVQEAYVDDNDNFVEGNYKIYVKYTVDNKVYEEFFDGLPEYKVGDKMTIYYNPSDPSQITQTKSMILPLVMLIGGIVVCIGGIISGIFDFKKYNRIKNQKEDWKNLLS